MLTWNTYFLGARLFYWAYLLAVIAVVLVIVIYYLRERLRKKYYEIRFPQELLILNIIYPAGYIKRFYRLIPEQGRKSYSIGGGIYNYNEEAVLRKNDWFARQKGGSLVCVADGQEYNLNKLLAIKERWERWPELWYKFGNPWPIDFNVSSPNELKYNMSDFARFKESKKLNEIYSALTQDNLVIFVLVVTILILVGVLVIMGKVMGWIK